MALPKNWQDVTLEQFAEIYDILQQTCPETDPTLITIWEIEKRCKLLSIVTGEPFDQLIETPSRTVKEKYKAISFINELPSDKPVQEFELGGYHWKVNYDITMTSGGNFMDMSELTKNQENVIHNAPQFLSIFCKPYKQVVTRRFGIYKQKRLKAIKLTDKQKASLLQYCPVTIAYPLTVFFCKVMIAFANSLEDSLIQNLQQTAKEIHNEAISMNDALGSSHSTTYQDTTEQNGITTSI